MQVEQAIFTSAQTSHARGYHLVARSGGIDDETAQQLALWAPSESALIDRDVDADSLNFFPVGDRWAAVSRTVYAGAEYSDRGQFRMETNILVILQAELIGYACDPLAVARAAIASGYLRLRARMSTQLSPFSLPDSLGVLPTEPDEVQQAPALVREIVSRFAAERLVVVGCPQPLQLLQQVFRCLPRERRLALSFSTGLKPSTHRPFRLQFLPEVNNELTRELESRGITCLMA
jgi:hypothetical protein